MSPNAAISVNGVSKRFRIYKERNQTLKAAILRRRRSVYEDFWALRDVDLEIPQGSTYALVGDNGSGKSTLLKCLAKILVPDGGTITTRGRMAAMLEVGSGFHPELSGRDNVYLNGSILGMSKKEVDAKFDEIVDFSGVEEFIDQPVKNYSSGMYVRLGFSVAIHTEPEILLVDEILAVGDAAFQEKCGEKFAEFRRDGRTVVLVSHSMPQIRAMADRAAWLAHGRIRDEGEAKVVLEKYADSTRANVRVDANGRVRWGSGEARVEQVELLDRHGTPTGGHVCTGDEVIMRLHYNAETRIEHPHFGFAMETSDGVYLWGNNTRDLEFDVPYLEGRGSVDLTVPRLPLQPGQYIIHGSIVDTSTLHVYDYLRDSARLYVARGIPFESGGPLIMDGRWSWPAEVHE
ncbi:ABC transporter ATP-binding protein [Actinomyces glycerinitolerans]|uniref:Abc transporter n=1 Tax=Actinomyces glycerinitolerans TaxID=1892869 RepID=A0A1M4RVI4_9ACTO|nr:ABC transporter ATP-binding protein [Actinomyces glycerinitolerans]SHE24004.1 abc transporter [Actinomyces glycerinitolerans]